MIQKHQHVIIIGAGMVGVCCASYLQRAGVQVTIVDPRPPGEGCSFGHAGVVAPGACLPMAMPGIWREVPGFLLDPLGPLSIRWRDLPRSTPWLISWLGTSTEKRTRSVSAAMRLLHRPAFDCLEPLLHDAGGSSLIVRNGQLYVSGKDPAVLGPLSRSLLDAAGIHTLLLDAGAVRDLEPNIVGARGGLLFPEHGHSIDPLKVVQVLAAEVARRGGRFVQSEVVDFSKADSRVTGVVTSSEPLFGDAVIIAAGAWSARLAKLLGTKIRLVAERGYHFTIQDPGVMPSRPISHVEHRVAITPMNMGLRIAGTVEISQADAPPRPERASKLLEIAKRIIPEANLKAASSWMGARPSLPDGLPVIDRAPHFHNAFFAFGHSHYGFMGAAPTGRLLANIITTTTPFIDPIPFAVSRFKR